MVEQQPETNVTSLVPLSIVRNANQLIERRGDICSPTFPRPNAIILKQGEAYSLRRALLVLVGEVYEYAEITAFTGNLMRQKMRTLPMGSIVFPQALNGHLSSHPSVCEYRAGENVKLLPLDTSIMELLGFSEASITFIAHAEDRMIRTLIENVQSAEADLGYLQRDYDQFRAEIDRLTLELQQRDAVIHERELDVRRLSTMYQEVDGELHKLTPPTSIEQLLDLAELASGVSEDVIPREAIPTGSSNPDQDITDLNPGEYQEIPDDQRPTLRPQPVEEPPQEDELDLQGVPQRDTLREFLAAPIIPNDDEADPDEVPQRMTITGVAPQAILKNPEQDGPPTTVRRHALRVAPGILGRKPRDQ